MFIQTEETPNPNSLKFLPGQLISQNPQHFSNKEQAKKKSTLAVKLFDIDSNIEAVFFGEDFITITKSANKQWQLFKAEILMTLMDHFVTGLPIYDQVETEYTVNEQSLSDLEKQIVEIIDSRVRPSVAMDGGDIVYSGFRDGVVYLELRGACNGCPSSRITLKNGIESMLQHFIPEVKSVEAV